MDVKKPVVEFQGGREPLGSTAIAYTAMVPALTAEEWLSLAQQASANAHRLDGRIDSAFLNLTFENERRKLREK